MAEQSIHDVVDQSLSVGDISPSDAPATTSNYRATRDDGEDNQGVQRERRRDRSTSVSADLGRPDNKPDSIVVTSDFLDVSPHVDYCSLSNIALTYRPDHRID